MTSAHGRENILEEKETFEDTLSEATTSATPPSSRVATPRRPSAMSLLPMAQQFARSRASGSCGVQKPSLLQRRKQAFQLKAPMTLTLDTGAIAKEAIEKTDPSKLAASAYSGYYVLQELGQGRTGVVYAAKRKEDGRDVAIKVMRMQDEELLDMARKEFDLLRGMDHPRIVRALDFFTYSCGAVLVMDHFPGKTLKVAVEQAPLGRFQEGCACAVFAALLEALRHLHERGVVHRDVKSENVLVSADLTDLRLVDFNTADHVVQDGMLSMLGTADYMPPEVLLGEELTEGMDIWAAGLCLHLMLCGSLPLERNMFRSHAAFGNGIRTALRTNAPLCGPSWAFLDLSPPCTDVVRRCLEVDPYERPRAADLLSNPLLSTFCV